VTEPGKYTYPEIMSQPAAWRSALHEVHEKAHSIREFFVPGHFSEVLFTGCGSTYYLSMAAAAHFQEKVGCPTRALPASELALFPETVLPRAGRPLLVAISRSGTTSETLRAIGAFRERCAAKVLAITCYGENALAKEVPLSIVVREGKEESIAQTRSFAGMLVALHAMTAVVVSDDAALRHLAALPAVGQDLLRRVEPLAQKLGADDNCQRFFFLGSGYRYGLACEAMLKMKEMSLSYSEAYHFMEFRHGPMSMVDDHTLIVGLLSDAARDEEIAVLRDMRQLGARTLVLAEEGSAEQLQADFSIAFESGVPEGEQGVLYLPALQLLAFHRAMHKGLNPDRPHNLEAVVVLESFRGT